VKGFVTGSFDLHLQQREHDKQNFDVAPPITISVNAHGCG